MAHRQTTRVQEFHWTDKDFIAVLKQACPDDLEIQSLPDEAGGCVVEVIDKRILKLTVKRVGSVLGR